jgi:hypothetical protein
MPNFPKSSHPFTLKENCKQVSMDQIIGIHLIQSEVADSVPQITGMHVSDPMCPNFIPPFRNHKSNLSIPILQQHRRRTTTRFIPSLQVFMKNIFKFVFFLFIHNLKEAKGVLFATFFFIKEGTK